MIQPDSSSRHHPTAPVIHHGDCLDVMRQLATCSFDAAITDPPYAIGFKRKAWDYRLPSVAELREIHRLLKPGAYLLAFSGSRTYHRMATRVEDAGFTIHPMLAWIFGTGFPKARELGIKGREDWRYGLQALKPAFEPIVMAQKPITERTMKANVQRWGTGALNIEACRVRDQDFTDFGMQPDPRAGLPAGRWPATIIHDGSEQVLDAFPDAPGMQSGTRSNHRCTQEGGRIYNGVRRPMDREPFGDSGSAARFFYCAKPTRKERDSACENRHPTVKPLALMRWLVQLVTPAGGNVLDSWCGSGTTGCAAVELGCSFTGIDDDLESVTTARLRTQQSQPGFTFQGCSNLSPSG